MSMLDNLIQQADLRTEADEHFGALEALILDELERVSFEPDETGYGPYCALTPTESLMPTLRPAETAYSTDIGGYVYAQKRRLDWKRTTYHDRDSRRSAYLLGVSVHDADPNLAAVYLVRSAISGNALTDDERRTPWTFFVRDCSEGTPAPLGLVRLKELIPHEDEELGARPADFWEQLDRLGGEERKLRLTDAMARLAVRTIARAFTESCQIRP